MKIGSILAMLFIAAVIYYVTGGGALLGFGSPTTLPDTMTPPNATFMGDEQRNPFVR